MIVSGFAPAKINLYLSVGAARPDGFHPLDSLAVFAADVGDFVSAAPAGDLTLSVSGPFSAALAAERDNLVLRAVRALAQAAATSAGARLVLDKRLPIASGMGGGSSDAAAALRVVNRMWGAGASDADLEAVLATVGADAPACLRATPVRMRGLGEVLSPAPLPDFDAVLVNPLTPASTPAVYRAFDDMGLGGPLADPGDPPAALADALHWLWRRGNDLELPARRVAPAIADVLDVLRQAAPAGLVRMSGSGATCFALVDSPDAADAVARAVAAMRPDWWVRATRLGGVDVTPVGG